MDVKHLNGDVEKAVEMVRQAMRRGQWDIVALVGKSMAENLGISDPNFLTDKQRLILGYRNFHGNLEMGGSNSLDHIPENLTVSGNLSFQGSTIKSIGENLRVGGSIYLYGSEIPELPEVLICQLLDMTRAEIKHIRKKNHPYSISLRNSQIEILPSGMRVGGYLNLRETKRLEYLPPGVRVGEHLDMFGSAVTWIGDGLNVRLDLQAGYSQLRQIGHGVVLGGLSAFHSSLESLPPDLVVKGDVELSFSKVTEIPPTVRIGGDLDCTGTGIRYVPPGVVKGKVTLEGITDAFSEFAASVKTLWG